MLYPCVSRNVFGKQKQMSQAGIQNVLNNAIMQQLCTSKIEKYLSITTKWLPVTKVTDNISQHHIYVNETKAIKMFYLQG